MVKKEFSAKEENLLEYVLCGLFHTEEMTQTAEQGKKCKFCNEYEPESDTHNELIYHLLTCHSKKLVEYKSNLDNVLYDPVNNLHVSFDWAMGMGIDSISEECAFCGEKVEEKLWKRHMNVVHKEEIERAKKLIE